MNSLIEFLRDRTAVFYVQPALTVPYFPNSLYRSIISRDEKEKSGCVPILQ